MSDAREENTKGAALAPESVQTEYLEFVGDGPFGTEFTSTHTISDKHMRDYHHVSLGKKEVVWSKGRDGRFLVPAEDLTAEAVEVLTNDPMFKRVTL